VKTCTKCGIEKELTVDNFKPRKKSKDGFRNDCRVCSNLKHAEWTIENLDKAKANQARWYQNNKEHAKIVQDKYYQDNKEKKLAQQKIYRKNNKIKIDLKNKNWADKNPAKIKQYNKEFGQRHPDKIAAKTAKRRAAKLQATPPWLTEEHLKQIEDLYTESKRLEALDGIPREVDHIIPLLGETVRGLHVPWNLRVITAKENGSKNNKLILID
jgi:hypothetical protein